MKNDIYLEWKLLKSTFNSDLQESLHQQHHAVQLIAMVGKYLVPQQADDSNTNMHYSKERDLLVGNKLINGAYVALHLPDLKLLLVDENFACKNEISIVGKTKSQVFKELKEILKNCGINVTNFIHKMHYNLPAHGLDKGQTFKITNPEALIEHTFYRSNAEIILCDIASNYNSASSVRVWPHHFDSGSYIPLEYNSRNEITKSISIGWAIPDEMVNEPYYYLSYWTENHTLDFNNLPSPDTGEWVTSGWKGGILKLSDILNEITLKAQYDLVKTFFHSGIKIIEDHLV